MADVFISYKSERRAAAEHLARIVELNGYSVWFDYALLSGHEFARPIERELRASRAVIVLWCTLSVESDWVRNEAFLARKLGTFLPAWIEKVDPPLEFMRDDTLDWTVWDGSPRSHVLDRLFEQLERLVGKNQQPEARGLREYEATWRRFGAPSLARFGLGRDVESAASVRASVPPVATVRTEVALPSGDPPPPPPGLDTVHHEVWKKAHKGDAYSQNRLGDFYYYGTYGLRQDSAEAVRWFQRAAKQGHAGGLANLGWMNSQGQGGLAKDDVEAVRLYQLAAEQGNHSAQFNLGWMHAQGRGGLAKNEAEAARLYRLAADQGAVEAQASLGVMHEQGRGGLTNTNGEAVRLYRLSADQGNVTSQVNLGRCHEQGSGGLARDEVEAVRLYRLAADKGNAAGQAYLADMTERGAGGVAQDRNEAIRLYRLAAGQGNAFAVNALTRLGVPFP